ncbi:MAG: hypothetical protein QOC63_1427, partial [Mycobacterium sp.]|nr:hypothetical protein [Mycobacterium sp.]
MSVTVTIDAIDACDVGRPALD